MRPFFIFMNYEKIEIFYLEKACLYRFQRRNDLVYNIDWSYYKNDGEFYRNISNCLKLSTMANENLSGLFLFTRYIYIGNIMLCEFLYKEQKAYEFGTCLRRNFKACKVQ